MAKYHVILQPEAVENVSVIFTWLQSRSIQGAASWFSALEHAVGRLAQAADIFPIAQESHNFDVEVRETLFRTRRGRPYRMIFTIQGDQVHVVYIRGPGQDWISP